MKASKNGPARCGSQILVYGQNHLGDYLPNKFLCLTPRCWNCARLGLALVSKPNDFTHAKYPSLILHSSI